jgi:hypothetical protein
MAGKSPFFFVVAIYLAVLAALPVAGWWLTWSSVGVPPEEPVFSDMRTVQAGITALQRGIDPQVRNPTDPWNRRMNYPRIWLDAAVWAHLEIESRYLAVCLLIVACFVCATLAWVWRFPSWPMALIAVSTSTFFAMERANNDGLIFALLIIGLALPVLAAPLVVGAIALKVYPAVLLAQYSLVRRTWAMGAAAICGCALLLLYYPQIRTIADGTPLSCTTAYGLKSAAQCLPLKVRGQPHWELALMAAELLAALTFAALFFRSFDRQGSPLPEQRLAEIAMTTAALLYCGTYVVVSNYDYRLIFLMLAIPYIGTREGIVHRVALGSIAVACFSTSFMPVMPWKLAVGLSQLSKFMVFCYLSAFLLWITARQ